MNIEYVGRNVAIDDALRRYAESKLTKVTKHLEEPVEVRLTLDLERHRHLADLHVGHRHGVLQATEETAVEWRDAINAVVDKIAKQARRGRKKASARRRRAATDAAVTAEPAAVPGAPTTG
jgi:putative sigma-54 modulation protein